MQQAKTLTWNDVADAADLAFNIWVGQPELRWAKQAWELIIKAGLATYTNELERCKAVTRFLALGGLYHDFCKVAWDEKDEPNYVERIELLRALSHKNVLEALVTLPQFFLQLLR